MVKRALEYRHANTHGYVFPFSGNEKGIFLTDSPRLEVFGSHGLMADPLDVFCGESLKRVAALIRQGWRCFEKDHLT
jgi:hypothetical protein